MKQYLHETMWRCSFIRQPLFLHRAILARPEQNYCQRHLTFIQILFCNDKFCRLYSRRHQLVYLLFQFRLTSLNDLELRLRNRMLGHENRAAILIRQNRRIVCTDFAGYVNDVILVKSYERTIYRQLADAGCAWSGSRPDLCFLR